MSDIASRVKAIIVEKLGVDEAEVVQDHARVTHVKAKSKVRDRDGDAVVRALTVGISTRRRNGRGKRSRLRRGVTRLAVENGLSTCPQEYWSLRHGAISEFVGAPDNEMLFCGVAVGHSDWNHQVNGLRSERMPFDMWGRFV